MNELDAASELDRQPAACSLAVIELNPVSGLGTVTPAASSIDLDQTVTNIAPCKCPAPVSDLVLLTRTGVLHIAPERVSRVVYVELKALTQE